MLTKSKKIDWHLLLFLLLLQIELIAIRQVSDLKPGTANWVEKANQILDLRIPTDNFYGPGSALLLAPFVLFGASTYLANHCYLALGSIAYWKLCENIPSERGRLLAIVALPSNFYLLWLIDSSQDTVFEFALLLFSCLFLVIKRIGFFALFGYLLCQTRAGYWIFFLGISFSLFVWSYIVKKRIEMKKLFAVYFLAGTSIFNFINYGSPSPALESGVTAYFSYTKYHYLALPKMDMDVFLSGKNGAFSVTNGPFVPIGSTSAEVNSIYHKAAFESVVKYKKETVLGIMQKFDSYFFDVQKIPHLPGRYVLDQDQGIIKIENERITWPLVLGNALFLIFRTTLVISCLIGVGAFINSVLIHKWVDRNKFNLFPLALPYIFGAVPGLFVYTETRFKIVSELLLVPLVIQMWSLVFHSKKSTF